MENRTWRSPYRGPLAIHAGRGWDDAGAPVARRILEEAGIVDPAEEVAERQLLARGAVLAVASGVSICNRSTGSRFVQCECGPWAMPGQFHWQLSNVVALPEPFLVSGKQGLWEVDLPDFPIGGAR